jgi:Xaa-Pro aminopeptidase
MNMQNEKALQIDWESLREHRRKRTIELIRDGGFEAIIVSDACNIRYVADIRKYGSLEVDGELHLVIINSKGEIYLITQILFDDLTARMPWVKGVLRLPAWQRAAVQGNVRADLILDALAELGVSEGRIGVDSMPFQTEKRLESKASLFEFHSVAEDLLRKRMIKGSEEIKLIEIAAQNNDLGMQAALDAMIEGVTEFEIVAAALEAMAAAGIEAITHYPGCRSGERTLTEYMPNGRRVQSGDPIILDMGNYSCGGYASDFCRTGFAGEPANSTLRCYEALLEAHMAGIDAIRPGTLASEVHSAINRSLRASGYPEPIYASGHGIGLGMIELPTIGDAFELEKDEELQAGMTICLEPITFTQEVGVKVEDVILVTEEGREVLTKTPY